MESVNTKPIIDNKHSNNVLLLPNHNYQLDELCRCGELINYEDGEIYCYECKLNNLS